MADSGATLSTSKTILFSCVTLVVLAAAGCGKPCGGAICRSPMVDRVRLHPFTVVKLPVKAGEPGGLDVRVEALSGAGRSVKALGVFRLELYGYRRHQGDPRGKRLATWTIDLSHPEANSRYWDAVLLAYRIPLGGWDISGAGQRVILELVFNAGGPRRLFDRRILDIPAR